SIKYNPFVNTARMIPWRPLVGGSASPKTIATNCGFAASINNAFHLSLRAHHASRDTDDADNRDDPGSKKRDRNTNHPQAPHDGAGALSRRASQRGEQTAPVRNDITLAVNLDRDINRRVGFIDLCARVVLALHTHVFNFAQRVER